MPAGAWLAPGFIDMQVNGGGDVLFNDDADAEGIAAIAAAHRRFGTTALLPTLISDSDREDAARARGGASDGRSASLACSASISKDRSCRRESRACTIQALPAARSRTISPC